MSYGLTSARSLLPSTFSCTQGRWAQSQKFLEHAAGRGGPGLHEGEKAAPLWIAPFVVRELRDTGDRVLEGDPHHAVGLPRRVGEDARLPRDRGAGRKRRNPDALAGLVVFPTVIAAPDGAAWSDLAQRKPRAAMDAQVLERHGSTFGVSIDENVLPQQLEDVQLCCDLFRPPNRMEVLREALQPLLNVGWSHIGRGRPHLRVTTLLRSSVRVG